MTDDPGKQLVPIRHKGSLQTTSGAVRVVSTAVSDALSIAKARTDKLTEIGGFEFDTESCKQLEIWAKEIILADEINRATPRTQSALLESMQEFQVTVDGETRILPSPFIVMATQNPLDMEGTFPLPEAQLDRFLMKISLGYPTEQEETDIILRFHKDGDLKNLDPVIDSETIENLGHFSSTVKVTENIRDYIIAIVRSTRENEKLLIGASPRGSLGLFKCSQAKAALQGRGYVIPDDVKSLTNVVLSHRIIPTSNARLRGFDSKDILEEIVSEVPVPMETK